MRQLLLVLIVLGGCEDPGAEQNNSNNTNNVYSTVPPYEECRSSDGNQVECEAKGCAIRNAVVIVTAVDDCIYKEKQLCLSLVKPYSTDHEYAEYCITNGQLIDSFALKQGYLIEGYNAPIRQGWTSCDTYGFSLCSYRQYLGEHCGDGVCQTFDDAVCYWDCE